MVRATSVLIQPPFPLGGNAGERELTTNACLVAYSACTLGNDGERELTTNAKLLTAVALTNYFIIKMPAILTFGEENGRQNGEALCRR
jgi:hypothetical protein